MTRHNRRLDQEDTIRIQFPVTVELEVPWSIALPPGDEQLPQSFQHALCIHLCRNLTRYLASPGYPGLGQREEEPTHWWSEEETEEEKPFV
jgi:hypothetical protein